MPKAYVIMSNDFPDSVYSSEKRARTYCNRMNDEDKIRVTNARPGESRGRIYYRVYNFEVK